jgi:hypothetical protein
MLTTARATEAIVTSLARIAQPRLQTTHQPHTSSCLHNPSHSTSAPYLIFYFCLHFLLLDVARMSDRPEVDILIQLLADLPLAVVALLIPAVVLYLSLYAFAKRWMWTSRILSAVALVGLWNSERVILAQCAGLRALSKFAGTYLLTTLVVSAFVPYAWSRTNISFFVHLRCFFFEMKNGRRGRTPIRNFLKDPFAFFHLYLCS